MFHMPMGTVRFYMTVGRDLFHEHVPHMPDPDRIAALPKQPVIHVSPARLHTFETLTTAGLGDTV
jgi:hypothetical protein